MKEKVKKLYKNMLKYMKKIDGFFNHIFKETKLKYIFQFLPNNIFLLIILFLSFYIYFPQITNNNVSFKNVDVPNQFSDKIIDKSVKQEFRINKFDKVNEILIFFNKDNENEGLYSLDIYEDDKVIRSIDFNSKDIKAYDFSSFGFKSIKVKEKSKYYFKIKPKKVKEDSAITYGFDNKKDNSKNMYYIVNGPSMFNTFVKVFSIILLVIFFVINYLINNKIINKNNILILFLFYGIIFLFLMPPLVEPDCTFHFFTSYRLSQYDITKTSNDNQKKKMVMPKNIYCLNNNLFEGQNYLKSERFTSCIKSEDNKLMKLKYDTGDKYVAYLPAAISIKFVDLFTNSPMILYYLSKLIKFLISFVIVVYAYKILPKYKDIFLSVIFLPMFVQQITSFSYDGILNLLSLLVICLLIKFKHDKKIDQKELILYGICSYIIYVIKAPYVLIPLSIVIIDKKKFGKTNKDKYIKILTMFILIVVISYLRSKYLSIGVKPKITESEGSNLMYLLHNPIKILSVIKNTYIFRKDFYIYSLIGYFGSFAFRLNSYLINSYLIIWLLLILNNKSNLKKKDRIITLSLMIILFVGIFASMYFGWSEYKLNYVEGVQGRYFIPLLLPVLYSIIPRKRVVDIKEESFYQYYSLILFIVLILLLVGFY